MSDSPDQLPPPSPPAGTAASPPDAPRSGGFDIFDVLLFFVGFFAFVAMCMAVPQLPPKLGLLPACGAVGVRHWLMPPKPRVARPYTALVGVLAGLLVIASVLLLGLAGLGFGRLITDKDPDVAALRAQKVAEYRQISGPPIFEGMGDTAAHDAQLVRDAHEAVDSALVERARHRTDSRDKSVKLFGAGAAALALAAALERIRTRPA
jgi:hypothetical protein